MTNLTGNTIGIDFGTSNSVVATWRPDGTEVLPIDTPPAEWHNLGFDRILPSVYTETADGRALFGWEAKQAATGRFEAVKRLFATQVDAMTAELAGTLEVVDVATRLFAKLRRSALDQGVDARRAVVTVPANSRGQARHRTKVCAGMGGFQVLALINEPTAAAMAYAARNPGDQQLLVFDWGGGTLDVTILRSVDGIFFEQASKGLPTKGGLDFDTRLRNLVLGTISDHSGWTAAQRRRFELDIELAKMQLSTHEFTVLQLPDGDSRRITRAMFEEAVMPLVEEARRPIQQCLSDLGIGPGGVEAVVMVGGTSKVPAVRRFVSELLGCDPAVGVDPVTAVGEGAAIAAAVLAGDLTDNDFFVSTEHALGTLARNPQTEQLEFSTIIPRNHKLPANKTETFQPVHPDQSRAVFRVVEGDPDVPVEHPDNVELKEFEVTWEPGRPDRSFDLTYEYDVHGIVHVTVKDNLEGRVLIQGDVSFGLSDEEKRDLVQKARDSQQTAETGRVERAGAPTLTVHDPEALELLEQAETKVLKYVPDDEAAPIKEAMDALRSAPAGELAGHKERLRQALEPYSYLF